MPKRPQAKPNPDGPFFANRLKGESPLTGPTARAIYQLANRLHDLALWNRISGDDPLWLARPDAEPPAAVSIMGSGGEIYGFKFYENAYSQDFLSHLQTGDIPDLSRFMAERQLLSVEYEFRSDLRAEDKSFLEAMSHPKTRMGDNPVFRSAHPGKMDWFITEEEGLRLHAYLAALKWFAESHTNAQIDALTRRAEWPSSASKTAPTKWTSAPRHHPTSNPNPPPPRHRYPLSSRHYSSD